MSDCRRTTRIREFLSAGIAIATLVVVAVPAISAGAGVDFNTRADTDLRDSPSSLAILDADGASIVVGDAKGIQLMRAEGREFTAFGGAFTDQPVTAVAAASLPAGKFVAYAVRGERAVHVRPTTSRGTIGNGPMVPVRGRPRVIIAAPPHGFVVVHSDGVDLLKPASAGAFRRLAVSTVTSAVDAAVIDLNGDEYLDLVLADEPLGELIVLQGVEGGEMGRVATLRTQRAPTRIAVVNLDADPETEVVVLGDLGLSIHDRARDGSLTAEEPLFEASHLTDLAGGDINGDGTGDVVYTNRSRTVVASLLGTPSGKVKIGPAFLTGTGPGRLLLAPLTDGSRQDIIVANDIGNSLTHIRHDRRGMIGVAAVLSSIGQVSDAAAADFNGDGNLDLALASDETGRMEVHLGQGNGHFTATQSYPIGVSPRAMVSGDWDADGREDLAIADFGADRVAVLQGNGRGGFAAPSLVATGGGPNALLYGDFGGPTGNDLAVANRVSDSISILHGDNKGHFLPGPVFEVGPRPSFLFWGDIDGDGDEDLVTGNPHYETITVLPREKVGFGTPYNKVLGDTPQPSVSYDLDKDGSAELIVTKSTSGQIAILKGAKGTFRPMRTIQVGRMPSAVELGDFDADGRQDIAVVHKSSGVIAILLRLN